MMELVIGSLICGGLVLACDDLMPFKTRSSLGQSWLSNALKFPEVICKFLTADRYKFMVLWAKLHCPKCMINNSRVCSEAGSVGDCICSQNDK